MINMEKNDKSCYDCTHRKVDHENYPYCGRTGYWLGVYDKAYCCVHYEDVDEE